MSKCNTKSSRHLGGSSGDHEWSRNRTPLTDAQRDLAGANVGLAGKFANQNELKYRGMFTREELFSVASEALVLAARGYRPDRLFNGRQVKFSVYAFSSMRRRLKLEIAENHVITIASHSKQADDVAKVRDGFLFMGDRDINVIDRPAPEYDFDVLAELNNGLAELDERSREIVERRAWGESFRWICRTYHVSSERVRQIAVEAVDSLRQWMGAEPGGPSSPGCRSAGLFPGDAPPKVARCAPPRVRRKRGEQCPTAKLDRAKVAAIRSRIAAGEPRKDLAMEYGVGQTTLSEIMNFQRWTEDAPCA